MKMKNVRVICFNNTSNGLDIYIEFSGQQEYLMTYRRNGLIYDVLCRGISLDDLRRHEAKYIVTNSRHYNSVHKKSATQLRHTIDHILKVADEYMADRETA